MISSDFYQKIKLPTYMFVNRCGNVHLCFNKNWAKIKIEQIMYIFLYVHIFVWYFSYHFHTVSWLSNWLIYAKKNPAKFSFNILPIDKLMSGEWNSSCLVSYDALQQPKVKGSFFSNVVTLNPASCLTKSFLSLIR